VRTGAESSTKRTFMTFIYLGCTAGYIGRPLVLQ